MRRLRRAFASRGAPALLLLSLALVACERCGAAGVAELLGSEGTVERSAGASPGAWASAPVGQRFELGDAVRTGVAASAALRVGASSGVRMQPSTMLRFLGERSDARAGVRLEAGDIELETDEAIALETEVGGVIVQPGARVRVRGGESSRIEVVAGRVIFEDEGETRTAEAGATIRLEVGRVVFEDETALAAAPPTEALTEARSEEHIEAAPQDPATDSDSASDSATDSATDSASDSATDSATDSASDSDSDSATDSDSDSDSDSASHPLDPPPTRFHLSIPAGESSTIHDPAAPTAVRIDFGDACPGRAVVTLRTGRGRARFAGEGSAIVTVPVGRATYSVACAAGRDPGRGTLVVRRDDGTHRLDPVPPRNLVDADGRTYDLLYQNALPILTVRWRDAGGAATLHVSSGGRERTRPAPGGRVELRSGELAEGTHRLWFTAGARRSPETTLRIRFDNAAPAASLREPARAATLRVGERVRVAGVALAGVEVRGEGVPLRMDSQMRFADTVTVPADHDALVVRFSHPRRGVHYYLRRVAGR